MKKSNLYIKEFLMKYAFVIIIVLVTLFFSFTTSNFFSGKNAFRILHNAAPVFIFSSGAAMVIMAGMVDLSIGSTMFLSAAVATILIARKHMNIFLVVLIIITMCLAIGIINGLLVEKFRLAPMIATMGMMIALRGIAQEITGGVVISLPNKVARISAVKLGPVYIDSIIALAIVVIVHIVHTRTVYGRNVTAIGNSENVARKLGINVRKSVLGIYVWSALIASVAGILTAIQVGGVSTTFGSGKEFVAISVAAIGGISMFGGKGKVLSGIILGVFTLTIIESGLNFSGASPYIYRFIQGGIIFFAMYAQSYQLLIKTKKKEV